MGTSQFAFAAVLRLRVSDVSPPSNSNNIAAAAMGTAPGTTITTIFEEVLDLSKLVQLKLNNHQATEQTSFPANFLFIDIDDSYYTSEEMLTRLTNPRSAAGSGNSGGGVSAIISSAGNKYFVLSESGYNSEDDDGGNSPKDKKKSRNVGSSQLETLRNQVQQSWKESCQLPIDAIRLEKMTVLRKLKEELAENEGMLRVSEQHELAEVLMLRSIQSEIIDTSSQCATLVSHIRQAQETQETKSKHFLKTKFLLEARQIKLLSELQTIYPIELLGNGEHSIRGLELPADL
jgi:hypothetical protein